jgi:hypothetical protein
MHMADQDHSEATNTRVAQGVVSLINAVAIIEGCTRENALAMVIGATTSIMMTMQFRTEGAAFFRAAADCIERGDGHDDSVRALERASMAWILAHFPSEGASN